ncbi:MAG TPA: potassium transporter TrkA, partial [Mycobacterium sp.]
RIFAMAAKTRVIAIARPDAPVVVHPRSEHPLRAGDTAYSAGPYRELLDTLRTRQRPLQLASGVERASVSVPQ